MDFRNNEQDDSNNEKIFQNIPLRKKYIIECPADLRSFKIIAEDGSDLHIEQREIIVQECDQCNVISNDSQRDSRRFVPTAPVTNFVDNDQPQKVACCYNCPFHSDSGKCCQSKRRILNPPFGTDCCCDRPVIKTIDLCPKYLAKCYQNGSFSNRSINDSNSVPFKTKPKPYSNDDHNKYSSLKSDSSSPNSNRYNERILPTSKTSHTVIESPIEFSDSVRSPLSFTSDFTKSSDSPISFTSSPPSYNSNNTLKPNRSPENQILPTIDEKQSLSNNNVGIELEFNSPCVSYNEKSFSPTKTTFQCFQDEDVVICVPDQAEILSNCAFEDQNNMVNEKEAVKIPDILPVPQTLNKDKNDVVKPSAPATVITPKNNNINTKRRSSVAKNPQQTNKSNISKKAVQKSPPAKKSIASNKSIPKQSGINKNDIERVIILNLINSDEKSKESNPSDSSKFSNEQIELSNVPIERESGPNQIIKTPGTRELIPKDENDSESDKTQIKDCGCKYFIASQSNAETVDKSLLAFVEEAMEKTEKTNTFDNPPENSEVLSNKYKDEPYVKGGYFSSTETNPSFGSNMNSSSNSNTNSNKKVVEEYKERERNIEVIPPSKNSEVLSDKYKAEPYLKTVSFSSTETSTPSESNQNNNDTKKVIEKYKERERNVEVSPLPKKSEDINERYFTKPNPNEKERPRNEVVRKKPNAKRKCSPCCMRGSESSVDTNAPRKYSKEDIPSPVVEEKEAPKPINVTNIPEPEKEKEKPPETVINPKIEQQKAPEPVAQICECGNVEQIIKKYIAQRRFQLVYPIDSEDFNFKPGHRCIASQTSQTGFFSDPASSVVTSNKSSNRQSFSVSKNVPKTLSAKKPGK